MGTVPKASLQPGQPPPAACPSPVRGVTLSHKEIRAARQDLPARTPHWTGLTPRLSCTCWVMALSTVCSGTFPGTQGRLVGP